MLQLTDNGQRVVNDVAQRHGFSPQAVAEMLNAVSIGYGNQAQFNHPEFGGMGQWSAGGMVMIGDMFNNYLKGRVSALCQELSGLIQGQPLFVMPGQSQSQGGGWQGSQQGGQHQSQGGVSGSSLFVAGGRSADWWPSDLGAPGSTGSQNNLRYAYFPGARRLAIDINGDVSVFDTGDHQIGGFSQQQGGDQSLLFTSQFGLVRVADLPVVSRTNMPLPAAGGFEQNPSQSIQQAAQSIVQTGAATPRDVIGGAPWAAAQSQAAPAPSAPPPPYRGGAQPMSSDEIFSLLEKLADLRAKGILTDAEFEAKKAEMLSRL